MSSPESPRSGLRRRGRALTGDNASDGFGSFVAASDFNGIDAEISSPISPMRSSPSFDPGLAEPLEPSRAVQGDGDSSSFGLSSAVMTPSRASGQAKFSDLGLGTVPQTRASNHDNDNHDDDDDEWRNGDLVQSFSPNGQASSAFPPTPGRGHTQIASQDFPDWDEFEALSDPSKSSGKSREAGDSYVSNDGSDSVSQAIPGALPFNPADEDFFAAFERAAKEKQARVPSPPIIDLRDVEKKMDLSRAGSQSRAKDIHRKPISEDPEEDFFEAFERAPEQALGHRSALHLGLEQLDSIHDAQHSPMRVGTETEYFGDTLPPHPQEQIRSQPKPIAAGGRKTSSVLSTSPQSTMLSPPQYGSSSPGGGWTGSIRKTWSSLRELSGEIVNHLPTASDFIAPHDDQRSDSEGTHLSDNQLSSRRDASPASTNPADSNLTSRRKRGSIAKQADYAHSTPFGVGGGGGLGQTRVADIFSAGSPPHVSVHHGLRRTTTTVSAPISGAPAFDPTSTRRWNTGSWTLDERKESKKRAIPVKMSDRREETEAVCEPWHAARIQAALPPRLQLGRTWKLLYSLDQHGISLQTLYHRVSSGLDPSKQGATSGAGVKEAEGWLRGASSMTKSALGVQEAQSNDQGRIKHVGSGLSLPDAGIVVAIKDDEDNVFGAFVNEKIKPSQHYYGNGECFLWKTVVDGPDLSESKEEKSKTLPIPGKAGRAVEEGGEGDGDGDDGSNRGKSIETFKWTGKNDYMVLTESDYISFGGGNGRFGLWLDGKLERGVSSRCPAFDNDILCDKTRRSLVHQELEREEKKFECIGLEVWAVGID
ncbi:TLD-domain-containing protein [Violaceomyces palustris]|uniref:TLD-domain-containing protein n=1 Tax=Violaceomyces palustris TaxID=1673888 RepID=A0ACD0P8F7_9BASI|nr:TLD-domain-containing protein [Violaceomyces palustris]